MNHCETKRFRLRAWAATLLALAGCDLSTNASPPAAPQADVAGAQSSGPDSAAQTATSDAAPFTDAAPMGPKPQFSPTQLDFGTVDIGSCAYKTAALSNWGDQPLLVKGLNLEGLSPQFQLEWLSPAPLAGQAASGGKFWVLQAPVAVAPYQSAGLAIQFCPTAPGPVAAVVQLLGNGGPAVLQVKATAVKSTKPCLGLAKWSDPLLSQFGGALPGQTEVRAPAIKNCGTGALSIVDVQLDETPNGATAEFAVDWSEQLWGSKVGPGAISPSNPLIIQPNGEAVFQVRYMPADMSPQAKPDKATLLVTLSDGQQLLKEFTGWGVEQICPFPVIKVMEGEQVVPGTMLHFSGTSSYSLTGAKIVKYQWTVKQPPGSQQELLPYSSAPETTLQANLSGEYEVCLHVWDDLGVKSCIPYCVKILVITGAAFHLELLWDTPNDPDQTDEGPAAGADLDLHFAHPLAAGPDDDCDGKGDPWFSNPFDAFWFNPMPKWGDANVTADDPSLDVDDTDGAGPENVSMATPEGTAGDPVAYSIGVHYWNDHGYGASYATLSMYSYGIKAFQISQVKLQPLDMWYVGKLHWPNALSGGSKKLVETCYQSGSSCAAGKKLMWQTKGDYCVTPCYIDKGFGSKVGVGAPSKCTPGFP